MLKTIMILMIFGKVSVSTLIGRCNQCFSANNIACLNETHFATCFRDSPTATHTKCPDNLVCTDDMLICRSSTEGYTPICYRDSCGECRITNGKFTCLNETTYGFCYGETTPVKNTFRKCPHRYVCNYNSPNVCEPEDKSEPSCGIRTITTEISAKVTESIVEVSLPTTTKGSTTTDRTTKITKNTTQIPSTTTQRAIKSTETTTKTTAASNTDNKPRDADTICREIGKTGFYESDDITCRQYVYCYPMSGQYLGWFHNCNYYFNAITQKCQQERPPKCIPY